MKKLQLAALAAAMGGFVVQAAAQSVTFYSDQGTFQADALAGGKVLKGIEDFEEARMAANSVVSFDDPLDVTTSNGTFEPGDIEANLLIQSNNDPTGLTVSPAGTDGLAALSAGFLGVPSVIVGSNTFVNSTDVMFNDPNKCGVGMDLFELISGQGVNIQVFDTNNALIGTTLVGNVGAAGTFLGILSPVTIGRINVMGVQDGGELVDNIQMWNAPVPEPMSMLVLGVGSALLAARRRKSA